MDTVLKSFSGLIIIMLFASVGIGLIFATLYANGADNYYSQVSGKISASHFADSVIQECIEDAKEKGYELTVTKRQVNGTKQYVGEGNLTYQFQIPILGIQKEYNVQGMIW
ncbi:MAG: hypothetical protein K6E64_07145 [Lachnospiraceae bacterium]|nr:hypothetical protein [Lachnospiraceae bacterium]